MGRWIVCGYEEELGKSFGCDPIQVPCPEPKVVGLICSVCCGSSRVSLEAGAELIEGCG